MRIQVNGATATTTEIASSGANRQYSVPLSSGSNVIRFQNIGEVIFNLFTVSAVGVPATPPSDWTNTQNRNIGPSGYVEIQGVSANSTWHVLQRSQLGFFYHDS
jgi:hypothetical protein